MHGPDGPLDDETWEVLHGARIRGRWEAPGDGPAGTLVDSGLAVWRGASLVLTAAGRELHGRRARLAPGSAEEEAVRRGFEAFLPLNRELLQVCSDWQVRPGGAPNDHSDPGYDWKVVDRLRELDDRVGPLLRRLARVLPGCGEHRDRLRYALARLDEGERAWFVSPRCDSYHTVWMQLHEELLVALGLPRDGA